MATAVPRSEASRRSAHGTASAYRAAVVTNSHRSAAASSWDASARLADTTESMSARRAWPDPEAANASPPVAPRPGRPPRIHRSQLQAGQHAVSDEPLLVVGVVHEDRGGGGRPQHPGAADLGVDDGATKVDLAPVEPPITASNGASREDRRGST